jgi:hypothetical protein
MANTNYFPLSFGKTINIANFMTLSGDVVLRANKRASFSISSYVASVKRNARLTSGACLCRRIHRVLCFEIRASMFHSISSSFGNLKRMENAGFPPEEQRSDPPGRAPLD